MQFTGNDTQQYHYSILILSGYSNLKVPNGGILLEDVYNQTLQAKLLQGRSFSLTLVTAILSASFLILTSEDCSKPLREKHQEGWTQYTL